MKLFFSCDWGTSTFRLRLVNAENAGVLSELKTDQGIAPVFKCWKQANSSENNRVAFYNAYLIEQVKKMETALDHSFHNAPIVLSGMASSGIGMKELPYKELPFSCDGSDLNIHVIPDEDHQHKIIMISGARSAVDVMRGEETILVGCNVSDDDRVQLFIFPGTHCKHIIVKNGAAQKITTYITGELFELLSAKSILSSSVKKDDLENNNNNRHFAEGVIKGASSNLLNSIFYVRTNQLFNKATPEENYHYLSGLLIGHELKDIAESNLAAITLVCSEGLKNAYAQAFSVLGLADQLNFKNADDTLINGQLRIMLQPRNISNAI